MHNQFVEACLQNVGCFSCYPEMSVITSAIIYSLRLHGKLMWSVVGHWYVEISRSNEGHRLHRVLPWHSATALPAPHCILWDR